MYMFKHRPLLFGAVVSVATLIISYLLPESLRYLIFLPILLAAILIISVSRKRAFSFFGADTVKIYCTVCVMALLTALSFNLYIGFYISPLQKNFGFEKAEEATLYGYFTDGDEAVIYGFENTSLPYKAILTLTEGEQTVPYKEFLFNGTVCLANTESSTDSTYYKSQNIALLCTGTVSATGYRIDSLGSKFYKAKEYAVNCVQTYCGEQSGFISGLVFGKRSMIPSSVYTDFRQTGTTHLCAVSGLHLVAVLAVIELVFSKFIPSKRLGLLAVIPLCILYVFISGGSMSVIRAGIMYIFCRGAFFARASNDPLTCLAFSAYVGFLTCPYAIYDVGFVLSLLSTFGLVVFGIPGINSLKRFLASHPFPNRIRRFVQPVSSSLIISLCCTVPIIPVLYIYYGSICPLSPITTLLSSFSITGVLYSAPLCVIFSFFPALSTFFGTLAQAFAELCVNTLDFCAEHFSTSYALSRSQVFLLLLFTAILAAIMIIKKCSKRNFAVLSVCFALIFCITLQILSVFHTPANEITVISEGDGELVCIISNDSVLICDSTDGNPYNAFGTLSNKLKILGINEVIYVITSCGYMHANYLDWLSRSISVKELYVHAPFDSTDTNVARLKASAEKSNIACTEYQTGISTVIPIGNTCLTLFASVFDGEKERIIYALGKNLEYVYCPIPVQRLTSHAEKKISDITTVIYGTQKRKGDYIATSVKNAKSEYVPDVHRSNGFSLYETDGNRINYFDSSLTLKLENEY